MHTRKWLWVSAITSVLVFGYVARADTTYTVTMPDISALKLSDAGPFYVDFLLATGSGGNTVTINNFNFDAANGGAAGLLTSIGTSGDAVGDIGGPVGAVTLDSNGSSGDNEFFQQFTPGNSLSFQVTTTENLQADPDTFYFSILDGATTSSRSFAPDPIPTMEPVFDEFLSVVYTPPDPSDSVPGPVFSAFSNDPSTAPFGSSTGTPIGNIPAPVVTMSASATPLPPSLYGGLTLLSLCVIWRWRHNKPNGGSALRANHATA